MSSIELLNNLDLNELKDELVEMREAFASEEGDDEGKLYVEIIDILLEEISKRNGQATSGNFREDVKFMSYLNLYEFLMSNDENYDEEFEDDEFEEESEDEENN